LVYLVEHHASGEIFDYSATQLLATWCRELLERLYGLRDVLPFLQGLAQSVNLTTGLGQAQIWSIFRDGAIQDISQMLSQEDLLQLQSVKDQCRFLFGGFCLMTALRSHLVQALSVATQSDQPDPELISLLRSLAEVRTPA
jgi:hypothetical protein